MIFWIRNLEIKSNWNANEREVKNWKWDMAILILFEVHIIKGQQEGYLIVEFFRCPACGWGKGSCVAKGRIQRRRLVFSLIQEKWDIYTMVWRIAYWGTAPFLGYYGNYQAVHWMCLSIFRQLKVLCRRLWQVHSKFNWSEYDGRFDSYDIGRKEVVQDLRPSSYSTGFRALFSECTFRSPLPRRFFRWKKWGCWLYNGFDLDGLLRSWKHGVIPMSEPEKMRFLKIVWWNKKDRYGEGYRDFGKLMDMSGKLATVHQRLKDTGVMDGNMVFRLFVGTINWQAKMYRDKMIPFILC